MDPTSISKKVQESQFLTEAEKNYWLEHLPTMTESQIKELDDILTQAGAIPVQKNEQDFLEIIAKANEALTHQ